MTLTVLFFGALALAIAVPYALAQLFVATLITEPADFVLGFWVTTAVTSYWDLLVVGFPAATAEWARQSKGEPLQTSSTDSWKWYFVAWLLFVVGMTVLSWLVAGHLRKVKGLGSVRQAPPNVRLAAGLLWLAYLMVVAMLLQSMIL